MQNSLSQAVLLQHFNQVVTVDPVRMTVGDPLGIIADGAIGIAEGKIAWVGPSAEIPQEWRQVKTTDCHGQVALPGLIDSHTHPVFAGNRADEFAMRLAGKTYLEIAAEGGGIQKTVQATREANEETLYDLTCKRLETAMQYGVTTLEAKSGYGLTLESELKSLAVLKKLQETLPLDILPTFMGAHDIAPEYKGRTEDYVDTLCETMIPAVAAQGVAVFNDVFCETGYFSCEQSRRILETGLKYGLQPRIHAEEFSDLRGAAMAAKLGALSADHLLHLSDAGIEVLTQGSTVATLLPGTAFFLRVNHYAPARKLLDAGVTVALATDFNPGSCTTQNLQLIMSLACLQMGMLPHEAIRAVTLNAAQALGKAADRGSLTVAKRADIACFALNTVDELLYYYGMNPLNALWIQGQPVISVKY